MHDLFDTLNLIRREISAVKESELVSLESAAGRVLAEDIVARKNLPAFDNSALDGYAFKFADAGMPLKVCGSIFAGDKEPHECGKNECFKIMTGAKMPKNSDTVLRVEDAVLENGLLMNAASARQHDGHRILGEEMGVGEEILRAGRILSVADVAMCASQGIYKLRVTRKLRVGVFSSGNELCEPWHKADEDSVYNANAFAIAALLPQKLCDISYLGIIEDKFSAVKENLALCGFDLLVSSGGASVGDADYMDEALKELGFVPLFEGITMRPAKPTKLYKKGDRLVFILPGNPLSAFLACLLVGNALIYTLCGTKFTPDYINATISCDLKLKESRNNLILGTYKDGKFTPRKAQGGSGMIKPLLENDYLLISEYSREFYKEGEAVKILKIC